MEIIISDPIFVTVVELVISNDGQEVIQKELGVSSPSKTLYERACVKDE